MNQYQLKIDLPIGQRFFIFDSKGWEYRKLGKLVRRWENLKKLFFHPFYLSVSSFLDVQTPAALAASVRALV